VCTGRNELCLDIEHVHAFEIEERADRGIASIGVIASGVAKFQPITVPFFNSHVDVVPGDRPSIHGMKARGWSAELM
jgi:hypothetical protein